VTVCQHVRMNAPRSVGVVAASTAVLVIVMLLSPAASAANGMTPVHAVCKYFTLSDAQQVFGSTVSRVPRTAPGSCLYAAPTSTLNAAGASNQPSPTVLVQMSRGPKPHALSGKPTPDAQRVRVGSVWGWYMAPTETTTNAGANIGTLLFYEHGRLVQVAASGTKDDRATSEHIGSVVPQHL
jgi:hypothetical protein